MRTRPLSSRSTSGDSHQFLTGVLGQLKSVLPNRTASGAGTFGIVGDFPTVMPVYHFNLMAGVTRVLDPRGTYLPDDDAARRYAKQLVRGQLVQDLKWSIEVVAENGDFVDMVEPPEGNHPLKS
jgi:hypothetical protein